MTNGTLWLEIKSDPMEWGCDCPFHDAFEEWCPRCDGNEGRFMGVLKGKVEVKWWWGSDMDDVFHVGAHSSLYRGVTEKPDHIEGIGDTAEHAQQALAYRIIAAHKSGTLPASFYADPLDPEDRRLRMVKV